MINLMYLIGFGLILSSFIGAFWLKNYYKNSSNKENESVPKKTKADEAKNLKTILAFACLSCFTFLCISLPNLKGNDNIQDSKETKKPLKKVIKEDIVEI